MEHKHNNNDNNHNKLPKTTNSNNKPTNSNSSSSTSSSPSASAKSNHSMKSNHFNKSSKSYHSKKSNADSSALVVGKQAEDAAAASSSQGHECIVCYRPISAFSIGSCEHSVCFECSARMRVLLEQNECPICRQSLDYVIFTTSPPSVLTFNAHTPKLAMYIYLPQYGIYLEDDEIKSKFDALLEFKCSQCQALFDDFEGLRMHMQRNHSLYACGLCTEFIKHFPHERNFYTRPQLALHNRLGDPDDSSHRGHPLCEFCDVRHFDSDELFKHLRKEHYFCHFCDADGFNFYYNGYPELRLHFRREHFLCEEEGCKDEKFTSVFREEIDWKAHVSTVHSRLLGKHATRAARSLDVQFALPVRQDKRQQHQNHISNQPSPQTEQQPVFVQPTINTESVNEFPTLPGGPSPGAAVPLSLLSGAAAKHNSKAKWSAKTRLEEDFPALGGEGPTVKPRENWSGRAGGGIIVGSTAGRPQQSKPAEDFPSLPTSTRDSAPAPWRPPPKPAQKKPSKVPAPAPELDFFVPLPQPQPKLKLQQQRPRKVQPTSQLEPLPTREELHEQLVRGGAVLLKRDEEDEFNLGGGGIGGKKKVKKKTGGVS